MKQKLTDFNTPYWSSVTNENLEKAVEEFNDRVNKRGRVLGELSHSDNYYIALNKVSHCISNIEAKDRIIYGDVEILKTIPGEKIKNVYDDDLSNIKFAPRALGRIRDGVIEIEKLYTWDIINDEDEKIRQ